MIKKNNKNITIKTNHYYYYYDYHYKTQNHTRTIQNIEIKFHI